MHTITIIVWSAYLLQPSQLTNPHYPKRPSRTKRLTHRWDAPKKLQQRKNVNEAEVIANPQTGSLHQPDFINEQSAGDTNSRFGEQRRVGVPWRGRLNQCGPCMLCFSKRDAAVFS